MSEDLFTVQLKISRRSILSMLQNCAKYEAEGLEEAREHTDLITEEDVTDLVCSLVVQEAEHFLSNLEITLSDVNSGCMEVDTIMGQIGGIGLGIISTKLRKKH